MADHSRALGMVPEAFAAETNMDSMVFAKVAPMMGSDSTVSA
jgi:hypothetical protein